MNSGNAFLFGSMVSSNAAAPIAPRPPPPTPPPAPWPVLGGLDPGLQVRPVTAANMEWELDTIASLLTAYPVIAIDTEYAGVVHYIPPPGAFPVPAPRPGERYALVKANVDAVPVVQLGITLCDEHGNLPVVFDGRGRPFEVAWEVTFSDFDARRHRHAPDSVEFLQSQGVDFDQARAHGVSSAAFAAKLAAVLSATPWRGQLTWVAFGGAHDFAYLVKMLAGGRPLPETWHEFMARAQAVLGGGRLFDGKYMAEHCQRVDLCGGSLRRVATRLGVWRNFPGLPCTAAQKSHTASLIYTVMRTLVLDRDAGAMLQGLIDGLQW